MTPNADQIRSWLETILAPDGRVELRAFEVDGRPKGDPRGIVRRIYDRDDLPDLVQKALNLSGRASGIFFTINPIGPDATKSASDEHISRRCLLLIDVDAIRSADLSSSEEEKAHAIRLADDLVYRLGRLGWPDPVRADSGNGHHLLYRVELPNDEQAKDLIQNVLRALAHGFDTADAHVDTSVYNASRITKLYGTLVCKGAATSDRPHRYSSVLAIPTDFGHRAVTREMLEAVVASMPTLPTPLPRPARPDPPTGGRWNIEDRVIAYLAKCPGGVSGSKGHNQTFKTACNLGPGFDLAPDEAYRFLWVHWNSTCTPPWSEKELRHKVEDAYKKTTDRGWLLRENRPTPLTPCNRSVLSRLQ